MVSAMSTRTELIDEVACLQLERLADVESTAHIAFEVRDARWLQRLRPGHTFETLPHP